MSPARSSEVGTEQALPLIDQASGKPVGGYSRAAVGGW